MNKKAFSLLFFGILLGLFEACLCGPYKPYFDYQTLEIQKRTFVKGSDTLQAFNVIPNDISFIASVYQPTLSTAAFGLSCPMNGEAGAKFSMTNIEIFADRDFNDTLSVGQSLSSIFYGVSIPDSSQSILQTLPVLDEQFTFYGGMLIYTPNLPADTSQIFELRINITKSDGSVASGKVSGVKFR